MKKRTLYNVSGLLPLCVALSSLAVEAHAADYSPFPPPGVYEASDTHFERLLTIKPNGQFLLEVEEKGKPGNLHSGAGEGKLSDAPGGWDFSEGRCTMSLKRAAGGMKLHVETCASAWGDVPFDGVYKKASEQVTAKPAKPAVAMPSPSAPAAPAVATVPAVAATAMPAPASAGLPTRKELNDQWNLISGEKIAGKVVQTMVRHAPSVAPDTVLERFSNAAFVLDTKGFYQDMSPAELTKTPLKMVPIPLPVITDREGLEFQGQCTYGKSQNVIVINIASQPKGKPMKSRRASAWIITPGMEAEEIKPASKAKCPKVEYGYS